MELSHKHCKLKGNDITQLDNIQVFGERIPLFSETEKGFYSLLSLVM